MTEQFGSVVQSEPEVRVYESKWNGSTKVHIRQFYDGPDGSAPTKKGVALDPNCVLETAQALLDVYASMTGEQYELVAS